jgi:transcription initiation factor TFIID subunit 4
LEDGYKATQDVRGQFRFLADPDRLEKRRHDGEERLRAKAYEMWRSEDERLRRERANSTALLAIGGPKKKPRTDDSFVRVKRVNLRDLVFLMEQGKGLRRSRFLWKACAG